MNPAFRAVVVLDYKARQTTKNSFFSLRTLGTVQGSCCYSALKWLFWSIKSKDIGA